jgi:hypothetical protein
MEIARQNHDFPFSICQLSFSICLLSSDRARVHEVGSKTMANVKSKMENVLQYSECLKPDHGIRATLDMQRVHEPDMLGFSRHHQGMCSLARAKESDSFKQGAIGNAGGRENNLLARRQVIGVINLVWIFYAH